MSASSSHLEKATFVFDVEIAADGPAGLEAFATRGADIVLLDLMLPGIPGTEVCRVIRTTANTPMLLMLRRHTVSVGSKAQGSPRSRRRLSS